MSPLATGYLIVVALLWAPRRRLALALGAVAFAGLLFTFSRSSLVALAGALVVYALVARTVLPVALAAVVAAVAIGWAHVFPSIGPTGTWTKHDLVIQRQHAKASGPASGSALSEREPSLREHWRQYAAYARYECACVLLDRGERDRGRALRDEVVEAARRLGMTSLAERALHLDAG